MCDIKSVLVTTGATVTFEQLINLTLSQLVLEKFVQLGFNKVIVQFGSPAKSEDLFISLITTLGLKYKRSIDGNGKIVIKTNFKDVLEVEGINFDKDLSKNYTKDASLVISHGGSGSILDALRLKKKLVVLNNEQLSEGHQMDIIEQFLIKDQLVFCNDNYKPSRLVESLDEVMTKELQPLRQANGKIVEKIIIQSFN